ncbi:MAG: amidohydrolase family protein [Rhodothermales bacterium]|nr:amidohydrolase family protein [Rhodothermales bacterium]MBO6779460.1 amidohydrolase family protein [Rhodothermales bacterium]
MTRHFAHLLLPVVFLLLSGGGAPNADFDLVLAGGHVLDGTGNPWFRADVGVRDGRIAAVGDLSGAQADHRVDVTGLYVLPGIVDMHSHAADVAWEEQGFDSPDAARRAAPNLVAQGITTVAINQDGRSPVDLAAQRQTYEESGIGINAVLMIGHGSVRAAVMADDFRRPSTQSETAQMQAIVRRAMEAGAAGMSAGLEYVPGRWSAVDEVVALMEVVEEFDGVYISHQRSEGADPMWFWPSVDSSGPPTLIDAVLETIEIGERTGGRVVASHIKAKGAHYWGSSAAAVQLIQAARDRGVQVFADQYPYTTSGSDGSTVLLPRWAFASREEGDERPDYARHVRGLLSDPGVAARLRLDIFHEIRRRGGADRVVVLDAPDSTLEGRSLRDIAVEVGQDPVGAALWLQLNGDPGRRGGVRLRGFSMDEQDVDRYAGKDWVATASDAGIALKTDGRVHPRYWGTFPRKIRRYAMDRQALSVADAVRSSTSLPAMLLGLKDRGQVREGFVADLAVIDLERIRDHATSFDPHAEPEGVVHVFLAGEAIQEHGVRSGSLNGRVLRP